MLDLELTKPTFEGRSHTRGPQIHQHIWGMFGSAISAGVSAKIASQNRKFQERMTRHRYQYQMEDMRKAGLNPMLAAGASPPASPPGAMAQIPDFGKNVPTAKLQAAQAKLTKKQGQQADSNVRLNDANARLRTAEAVKAELEASAWGVPASAWDYMTGAIKGGYQDAKDELTKPISDFQSFKRALQFLQTGVPSSAKTHDIRRPAKKLE